MKVLSLICFVLCAIALTAQVNVNVSILNNLEKNKIEVNVLNGTYNLSSQGQFIRTMEVNETFIVRAYNHEILTEKKDQKYFKKSFFLRVDATRPGCIFQIKSINDQPVDFKYKGAILITADGNELKIINILELDDYLVGVLRAEVGGLYDPEFLKSMAIISRTYTLRNLGKNLDKGFDLTDQVDCQVYVGVNNWEKKIVDAVKATSNEVILDTSYQFIDALFHSNSGGLTSRASYVWSRDLEYCEEVEDSFSMFGKHYEWTYKIPKNEWHVYLMYKYDSIPDDYLINHEYDRRKFWKVGDSVLLMIDIRKHFRLKSALFNVIERGDSVVFEGRGYGHGVGMSQEGAYEMSLQGFSYEDIILHYYHNVQIGCLSDSIHRMDSTLPLINRIEEFKIAP